MRNPIKSEFFTFSGKASGTQGAVGWYQLNVGGAREIVFQTSTANSPASPAAIDWYVTNQTYNEIIDANTGFIADDAQYMPIPNAEVGLVVHSNDEYLNIFTNPDGKGTTLLHVWVIR